MSTVVLPAGLDEAMSTDLRRQKARAMGLRSKLARAGIGTITVAERAALSTDITRAEAILRQMRFDRFPAEDAAIEAMRTRSAGEFAPYARIFPRAADLVAAACGAD